MWGTCTAAADEVNLDDFLTRVGDHLARFHGQVTGLVAQLCRRRSREARWEGQRQRQGMGCKFRASFDVRLGSALGSALVQAAAVFRFNSGQLNGRSHCCIPHGGGSSAAPDLGLPDILPAIPHPPCQPCSPASQGRVLLRTLPYPCGTLIRGTPRITLYSAHRIRRSELIGLPTLRIRPA